MAASDFPPAEAPRVALREAEDLRGRALSSSSASREQGGSVSDGGLSVCGGNELPDSGDKGLAS
ncbi:hypothetical protein DQ392_21815 [Streptomyces reniochalinae]|uniref:Uncharacterized protein n=1 Tax=Streptomyces reniochalinae TaxID=2250578 RepID=A0A367EDL2_9ACTN|nr:hypothetical protein DQ392_21815 [Streptomyces reniochalinae]